MFSVVEETRVGLVPFESLARVLSGVADENKVLLCERFFDACAAISPAGRGLSVFDMGIVEGLVDGWEPSMKVRVCVAFFEACARSGSLSVDSASGTDLGSAGSGTDVTSVATSVSIGSSASTSRARRRRRARARRRARSRIDGALQVRTPSTVSTSTLQLASAMTFQQQMGAAVSPGDLAESDGYCYLRAIRPCHRTKASRALGCYPQVSAVAAMPSSWFVRDEVLANLHVTIDDSTGHVLPLAGAEQGETRVLTLLRSVDDPASGTIAAAVVRRCGRANAGFVNGSFVLGGTNMRTAWQLQVARDMSALESLTSGRGTISARFVLVSDACEYFVAPVTDKWWLLCYTQLSRCYGFLPVAVRPTVAGLTSARNDMMHDGRVCAFMFRDLVSCVIPADSLPVTLGDCPDVTSVSSRVTHSGLRDSDFVSAVLMAIMQYPPSGRGPVAAWAAYSLLDHRRRVSAGVGNVYHVAGHTFRGSDHGLVGVATESSTVDSVDRVAIQVAEILRVPDAQRVRVPLVETVGVVPPTGSVARYYRLQCGLYLACAFNTTFTDISGFWLLPRDADVAIASRIILLRLANAQTHLWKLPGMRVPSHLGTQMLIDSPEAGARYLAATMGAALRRAGPGADVLDFRTNVTLLLSGSWP